MNYMDSETQEPDDLPYLETEYDMPPPLAAECKSFKWKIEVIGNITKNYFFHLLEIYFLKTVCFLKTVMLFSHQIFLMCRES